MITLTINGKKQQLDIDPEMPLLWALRDELHLTGTKLGCGMGMCGACTVHVNGKPMRSCNLMLKDVEAAQIYTIEGANSLAFSAVQTAWQVLDVVQCGYCQSGQIMSATALLESHHKPTDAQIDEAMSGNLCRCATYKRIRQAIHHAAEQLAYPAKGVERK
jgi:isoquinoline 1-oxidoreductase subunit alpha